ncbi:MAG TPA: sigma-54 dependent transcriptional regulator [Candidatus Sulfotelmatobacter sp.]|nr:sigma-54 dependent transcriptional regulator [Candidatus Sulfotelmatobacter sp.]
MPIETPRLLIVDDDPGQRSLLDSFLRSQGFETVVAESGERALELLPTKKFSLMISDVRMPGLSGLETLQRARKNFPTLPVLLVTAYTDIREAVAAMRDGAVNYLAKPIDLDELLANVRNATGTVSAEIKIGAEKSLPPHIIARSPLMVELFQQVALIAPSETRVLITGDSGTGKEVVADMIHAWSTRAANKIVKVNCAAIPETLLESELFGHEKGAFTGASAQRIGRFEEAGGGTIFLDEIAEMSPPLQAKILRVTQNGTFQRVGANRELHTDARILAASNKDLEAEVKTGRFREDLFYRLNVVELNVPPLQERREDILPLADLFISQFARSRARLAEATADCLKNYPWPGNVRELRNIIERAVLLSQSELILPEHLPAKLREAMKQNVPALTLESQTMDEIERTAILAALKQHKSNRTETAKALGISRRALLYKLQRLRQQGFQFE